MRWFRNRKTATKLLLGFGVMSCLLIFVGWEGARGMGTVNVLLEQLYHRDAVGLARLRASELELTKITTAVHNAVLDAAMNKAEHVDDRVAEIQASDALLFKNFDDYRKTIVTDKNREDAKELEGRLRELRPKQDQVVQLAKAGKTQQAYDALEEIRRKTNDVSNLVDRMAGDRFALMQHAAETAEATYSSTLTFTIGVIVVAVILSLGLGTVVARMIAVPLAEAVEVLEQVAGGDLSSHLAVDSEDEVGRLAVALNQACDAMGTALGEVMQSAGNAASASEQLAAAAEQLSSGAQEQASSLEQTAAALEQITGTVKQNADNARQADQLASGSRDTAEKGGQVVTTAVAAMDEINRASKRIADIITAIDEIAFQTNLLALNAAVEAARAGEQGRGFAVVAAEVRNLAQRSATAAKEIKALIQDSVGKVETGSELVTQSGQTLGEIVASVKRVTDIIAEIAAASHEQSSGIDQVNKAITQMDQVTQSNAAQTEELSSTAQGLASQAEELNAMVGRFKLPDRVSVAPATRPVPPAAKSPVKPRSTRAIRPAPAKPVRDPRRKELALASASAAPANGSAHGREDGFEEF